MIDTAIDDNNTSRYDQTTFFPDAAECSVGVKLRPGLDRWSKVVAGYDGEGYNACKVRVQMAMFSVSGRVHPMVPCT